MENFSKFASVSVVGDNLAILVDGVLEMVPLASLRTAVADVTAPSAERIPVKDWDDAIEEVVCSETVVDTVSELAKSFFSGIHEVSDSLSPDDHPRWAQAFEVLKYMRGLGFQGFSPEGTPMWEFVQKGYKVFDEKKDTKGGDILDALSYKGAPEFRTGWSNWFYQRKDGSLLHPEVMQWMVDHGITNIWEFLKLVFDEEAVSLLQNLFKGQLEDGPDGPDAFYWKSIPEYEDGYVPTFEPWTPKSKLAMLSRFYYKFHPVEYSPYDGFGEPGESRHTDSVSQYESDKEDRKGYGISYLKEVRKGDDGKIEWVVRTDPDLGKVLAVAFCKGDKPKEEFGTRTGSLWVVDSLESSRKLLKSNPGDEAGLRISSWMAALSGMYREYIRRAGSSFWSSEFYFCQNGTDPRTKYPIFVVYDTLRLELWKMPSLAEALQTSDGVWEFTFFHRVWKDDLVKGSLAWSKMDQAEKDAKAKGEVWVKYVEGQRARIQKAKDRIRID